MIIDTKTSPLVILGYDAADSGFLERWIGEGYLPTLASIMKSGCWGRTGGAELISEHGICVSMFSGISRGQHGYYFLRQIKPGTYNLQTVSGPDTGVAPFWAGFRRRDKRVAIIDVPDGHPVTGVAGIQLANWATHTFYSAPATEPPELLQDVRRLFGRQMRIREKWNASLTEDLQIYRCLLERIKKKGALCSNLLQRDRFDLIIVVFSESHLAGHQFWKYRRETHSRDAPGDEELVYAIRDIYQAIDRQMGLLLQQVPDRANVFIVSSVGMKGQYPTTGLIEDFCRKLGYQAPHKSNGLSFRPIDLTRRIVPESWRIALSRHLPRETRERLLADQFRNDSEWRKTTAFAIPSFYTSLLRVNLRGREPAGIVAPDEYEPLLDRLEADLKRLIDPQTSRPAVERIERAVNLFGGDPPVSLPDLFVIWKPAAHLMERLVHPTAELMQEKPEFLGGVPTIQKMALSPLLVRLLLGVGPLVMFPY